MTLAKKDNFTHFIYNEITPVLKLLFERFFFLVHFGI